MAFQLIKHGQYAGCHLFELLYGREFTKEELSIQPIKEICTQSLLYDDQLEQDFMRQKEQEAKSGKDSSMVIGTKNVNEILYDMKHPELRNAIVTLLTTEEFKKIAESKNHN